VKVKQTKTKRYTVPGNVLTQYINLKDEQEGMKDEEDAPVFKQGEDKAMEREQDDELAGGEKPNVAAKNGDDEPMIEQGEEVGTSQVAR
jgi:hypothetical protein